MYNDSAIFRQPEQARARIAQRWIDGNRTDFDKTETQTGERLDRGPAFVETRR
jgi:hypothetical protein